MQSIQTLAAKGPVTLGKLADLAWFKRRWPKCATSSVVQIKWQCCNVAPSERPKPCSDKSLLRRSNIASVAMLLGMVAMLLIDPLGICLCGLQRVVTRQMGFLNHAANLPLTKFIRRVAARLSIARPVCQPWPRTWQIGKLGRRSIRAPSTGVLSTSFHRTSISFATIRISARSMAACWANCLA
jgi:hypothetical protein